MAMADVYCLFNRARGTELVSPDDLLQACTCFPQAGVPLSIKQFSTGALVVQSRSHSTEQVGVPATPQARTRSHTTNSVRRTSLISFTSRILSNCCLDWGLRGGAGGGCQGRGVSRAEDRGLRVVGVG